MHRATTFLSLFFGAVMLTVLMSANAQEATPFPPETTVVPEGAVYAAPSSCTVSPDESQVVLHDYAVFSLPDGQKLYDISGAYPSYSQDSRYFTIGQVVYEAETGEIIFNQGGQWGITDNTNHLFLTSAGVFDFSTIPPKHVLVWEEESPWFHFLPNGDIQRIYYIGRAELENSYTAVYDSVTFEKILDTHTYGQSRLSVVFSSDYSLVAIYGQGVFTYPSMELVYALPSYTSDSYYDLLISQNNSRLLIRGWADDRLSHISQIFDLHTGELINTFTRTEFEANMIGSLHIFSYDMSKTVLPIFDSKSTNLYGLVGWSLVDVMTGEILETISVSFEDGFLEPAYELLQKDNPIVMNVSRTPVVHGRYATSEGVFDAETDELILPLEANRGVGLTAGGSYVVTQPCTVWRLP